MNGYEPVEMDSEDEARDSAGRLIEAGKWPCYFFDSDTSGEKPFEEFYSPDDTVDWNRFEDIGVITARELSTEALNRAESFIESVMKLRSRGSWTKRELVDLIVSACPELEHVETGKYLDEKM
jgi:hypothetical protein